MKKETDSSNSLDGVRRGPISWMAANPIAANLLMLMLLLGGIWTAFNIQKEVFPDFQLDIVEVIVEYPGAAPEEVEQGVVMPVEEAIRGVEGIKEIQSESFEGNAEVLIELVAGTNRMRAYQEIDQAISRIRTFPEDIEEPEVRLQSQQREVMSVVLYGEVDIWSLRKLAEQLRDQLLSADQITQVIIDRVPDYVTHVEIPRDRLRQYGLTLGQVADVIRSSSNDVPAGVIETQGGEILLRMKERKEFSDEFGQIEIVESGDGSSVLLADIADIRDGFEERGFHSKFNRTPSVQLEIYRVGDQSPMDVSDSVFEVMENFAKSLPAGISWRIDGNQAEEYSGRMSLLIENGLLAILIVLAILTLFLEMRLAFWVMMGMTASFIGGIVFLPVVGVSISMISMFAFLIVLGIVVDDAVVVGENVYEMRQTEKNPLLAAIKGAREVAHPVIFSILTTVVAFIPLIFIPGTIGKFWQPLPFVVIVVLLVSLVEALLILPSHLAHLKRNPKRSRISHRIHELQQRFSKGFTKFVNTHYRRLLEASLKFRYVTIAAALALFLIIGGYATSSHMGMILMPEVSADEIEAGVTLPVGSTPAQVAKVADDVTEATHRMFEKHDLHRYAEGIKTNVRGGTFVDVEIVMKPPNERDITAPEIIRLWRDEIGDIAGVDQITFEAESGPGGYRPDILVSLSHSDTDVLEQASQALLKRVEEFETSRDVRDDYEKGKKQLDFKLRPEGRALGLTSDSVGQQVRDAFFGALALRQLRGTNEVEIRVKLPKEQRMELHNLEELVILTPDGTEVPLFDVVDIERTEAFNSINRRDGRRVVNIETDVEPKRAIGQVITALRNEVLPEIRADFPGVTWTFEGSESDMRESTQALWSSFSVAMVVIYSILAIAFRSYLQPFIVLAAIPFGIIGAVIGHILLGFDISLISLMGVIALSGVVVNDALIMIDFANRETRGGSAPYQAIRDAGLRRFRPIILTTLTTFGGLTPIILERSMQAQYLIPMAISLGFGIVFATGIILLLVPCLYLALADLKNLFKPIN